MITKTITLYTYEELSETAKARARDDYRELRDASDLSHVIEDAQVILETLGVTLKTHETRLCGGGIRQDPNIWWSVGYCQSDGACFEGTYTHAKGSAAKIRRHAPQDQELHRIADALLEIQKRYRYKLYATVRQHHSGFSPEVEVDVDHPEMVGPTPDDDKAIRELMRDLCRWIYQQLRDEDEYQSSDQAIDGTLQDQDWTYTKDGAREDV